MNKKVITSVLSVILSSYMLLTGCGNDETETTDEQTIQQEQVEDEPKVQDEDITPEIAQSHIDEAYNVLVYTMPDTMDNAVLNKHVDTNCINLDLIFSRNDILYGDNQSKIELTNIMKDFHEQVLETFNKSGYDDVKFTISISDSQGTKYYIISAEGFEFNTGLYEDNLVLR